MKMTIREYLNKRARDPSKIADHPCWGDGSHYDYDRPVKILRSHTFFSVEEINVRALHHQEDVVFRWLAARRDYPYDKPAAPEVEPSIMQRCVREFIRSNPGFAL